MTGFPTEKSAVGLQRQSARWKPGKQTRETAAVEYYLRQCNTWCIICNGPMHKPETGLDEIPVCEGCL